jgi:glutamyl-tRNA reductase
MLQSNCLTPILERRPYPLTVIDLGVPRNLEPSLAAQDGVRAVFLDQLHYQIRERSRVRKEALERAEGIVREEVRRLERWLRQYPVRPFRADIYCAIEAALGRWRNTHPVAVQHLRVSLHKSLHQSFQCELLECDSFAATNS